MRQGDSGMFTMRVHSAPDGSITIEAEKADPDPVSNLVCRITGPGRAIDVAMTEADASIYRGEVGPLPRGKYTATLMFKAAESEKVLEQRDFAAAGSIPADTAELRIKPPNLESAPTSPRLRPTAPSTPPPGPSRATAIRLWRFAAAPIRGRYRLGTS